ncbi:MAG: ATP-binding protein [bacterium]
MTDDTRTRNRRKFLIIFGIISVIAIVIITRGFFHVLEVRLKLSDDKFISIIILTIINIITVILLIALGLLIFRNLIKLYFERKRNILGAKFKTKLIVAFIGLSIVPSILIFWVASSLISNSIDNWFNTQQEESLKKSLEIAQVYYSTSFGKAFDTIKSLNQTISKSNLLINNEHLSIRKLIKRIFNDDSQIGEIRIFDNSYKEIKGLRMSNPRTEEIQSIISVRELIKRGKHGEDFTLVKDKVIESIIPIFLNKDKKKVIGYIVFNYNYPYPGLMEKINDIRNAYENYTERKAHKKKIKQTYNIFFLLPILVVIFSATWFGFYLARGITIPIQKLAEGMRFIAEGDLDHKVNVKADDEVGILIDSFNKMTGDLKKSLTQLEKANVDLKKSNLELDQRRNYIEYILENITTGVISLDKYAKIITINKSTANILKIDPKKVKGLDYSKAFSNSQLNNIKLLIEESISSSKPIKRQLRLNIDEAMITIFTVITPLKDDRDNYLGIIMVLDDLTQLIKAQKMAAWREVARRIAHEIKNPLTPIQLCTQRLRKKFLSGSPDFKDIFDESTKIIITEVETLKELVNEFSNFARLPQVRPQPNDLHKIIEEVVSLYAGIYKQLTINNNFDKNLPIINIDREQMKSLFVNIIDNAVQALKHKGLLDISTFYNRELQLIRIEIKDNGPGIPAEDKDKLFLPYFSTRKSGTGLGLAIVHRIITDHNGYIRIEDNIPKGTKFIIELPVDFQISNYRLQI